MISLLLAALFLAAGGFLVVVAGLLAWDDARARAWEHDNARRWEDE